MEKILIKQDILDLFAEAQKRSAEADKRFNQRLERDEKKRDQQREKDSKEWQKKHDNMMQQIRELTGSWSKFAEELVKPKIIDMFLERGINLTEFYPHVKVKKNGIILLEIDLLLVNDTYSVVVEIKTNLTHKEIEKHLNRLEKLQQNPIKSVNESILLGAVAGMVVSESVENYAKKSGLFVIKQKGDTIEITNGPKFKPKEWRVRK